ncbi:hypothetical protein AHAS_Ahas10G0151600 [Arachis hypogaea]
MREEGSSQGRKKRLPVPPALSRLISVIAASPPLKVRRHCFHRLHASCSSIKTKTGALYWRSPASLMESVGINHALSSTPRSLKLSQERHFHHTPLDTSLPQPCLSPHYATLSRSPSCSPASLLESATSYCTLIPYTNLDTTLDTIHPCHYAHTPHSPTSLLENATSINLHQSSSKAMLSFHACNQALQRRPTT